ncbi:MAG: hypothetical protein IT236_05670 [Bacteroidia bacterium]|nr:hypothetical protein [Bacteroidia bacterium]
MDKKTIAKYRIEDTFKITGRGLVFGGEIIEGEIHIGDAIEFVFSGQTRLRKIKGIELIRRIDKNPNFTGLLIGCIDQNEVDELKGHLSLNQIGLIYKADK